MGSNIQTVFGKIFEEQPMAPPRDTIYYVKPVYASPNVKHPIQFDVPKKIGDNLYEVKEIDAFETFNQIWLIF